MFCWDGWAEDDDGNTAEFRSRPEMARDYSVTEANDDDILEFAGYAGGPSLTVQRDFDGRAYIYQSGAQVAVVESSEWVDNDEAADADPGL